MFAFTITKLKVTLIDNIELIRINLVSKKAYNTIVFVATIG
jgi:hypothetical protein